MGEEKLHELEILLTEIKASDKSAHKRIDSLAQEVVKVETGMRENTVVVNRLASAFDGTTDFMNEIKLAIKTMSDLVGEVKLMRSDINSVKEHGIRVEDRLQLVESESGNNAKAINKAIVEKVILVIIAGVVGYFLKNMGM